MNHYYRKLEDRLVDLHAGLPHLPQDSRTWLANNIWWIVLIGAILGGFGAAILVIITLLGGVFLAGAVFLFAAKFGGLSLLIATIIVALTIFNVVVSILAIRPLKAKFKKGWLLLTASLVIGFVAAVLTDIIKSDAWAIVRELLFLGIGGYILLEIRNYFLRLNQ